MTKSSLTSGQHAHASQSANPTGSLYSMPSYDRECHYYKYYIFIYILRAFTLYIL